ncbi:MAG: hypothetical protein ACHQUB_00955 [Candidatus Saccharimonadia bacterium]
MAKQSTSNDVMKFLDTYFGSKSPVQMPKSIKEVLVEWGPWINLLLIIVAAPLLLAALGLSLFVIPFSGIAATSISITWIVLLVQLALQVLALPGLFARKTSGWMMLFYAALISLLYNLVTYNIVGAIIGAIIAFWILFQIRSYYS